MAVLVNKISVVIIFSLLFCSISFANKISNSDFTRDPSGEVRKIENIGNGNKDNKVIVEPRNIIPVTSTGKMEMVPYRDRRTKWGQILGVSYGLYTPSNYKIDQVPESFSEFYPVPVLGLLSVEAVFKRNFDLITMGIFGSVGYFNTTSDVPGFDAQLTIIPIKLGFILEIETLWREPWVVPYVHGGIYSTIYEETGDFTTLSGTTLLAFYMSGGLMFQVDWLDDHSAREGYVSSGIENTFIFIEGNFMSNSIQEQDPGFGAIYASAGMKVEF